MMYIVFTETQKNQLIELFRGITYSPNKTRFDFVRIKNNQWILPETVKTDPDILNFLTQEKRQQVDAIIAATVTREITENDKYFGNIFTLPSNN